MTRRRSAPPPGRCCAGWTGFEFAGEASSGREAIELVDRLHPALVLMDINMPEMSGIEATRQIVTAHPDVVVILCSTYDAPDLPPGAAASGATAYVNKERLGRRHAPPAVGGAGLGLVRVLLTRGAGRVRSGRWASRGGSSEQRDRAEDLGAVAGLATPSAPCRRSRRAGRPC